MQEDPQTDACGAAHGRQNDVLAEDVRGGLPGEEAEHLDRRDLADALDDVDVRQVVDHHEGQRARAEDHEEHHVVHRLDQVDQAVAEILKDSDRRDVLAGRDRRLPLIDVRLLGEVDIETVDVRLSDGLPDRLRRDDDVIVDVVLKDAGDRQAHLFHVLAPQSDLLPGRYVIAVREAYADQGLTLCGYLQAASLEIPHSEERLEIPAVGSHQIDRLDDLAPDEIPGIAPKETGLCSELPGGFRDIGWGGAALASAEDHLRVRHLYLIELRLREPRDRVLEPEAREQQGHAAPDSENHHDEALFVAEDVPDGDLAHEGHPVPDGRDPLQKDSLAGFRRLGPKKRGGALPQRAAAGEIGCSQRAKKGCGERPGKEDRVEQEPEFDGDVHRLIRVPDDRREEEDPSRVAGHAAEQRRASRVDHKAAHDRAIGISQPLEHADLTSLLLHHAAHGRYAHERRDEDKEEREDTCDAADDLRVVLETYISDVGVSLKEPGVRLLEVVELPLGVSDLLLGVGDLFVELSHAVLVFLKAVLVLLEAVFVFL